MEAAGTLLQISGAKRILILYSEGGIQAERLKGAKLMAEGVGALAFAHWVPAAGAKPCADSVRAHILRHPDAGAILCLDGALTDCAAAQIRALGLAGERTLAGFDCDQPYFRPRGRLRALHRARKAAGGGLRGL